MTDFRPPESQLAIRGGLWSFQGRVSRAEFWAILLGASALGLVIGLLSSLLAVLGGVGVAIGGIAYVVTFAASIWVGLATQVKRWHDRGKSGWMTLINLIPIVGAVWVLVELGFLAGPKWANPYGPDPTG